tara:strand:- start:1700 stop:2773 length:1074 start_codon:yes stop_codon:yes gene_type:complete
MILSFSKKVKNSLKVHKIFFMACFVVVSFFVGFMLLFFNKQQIEISNKNTIINSNIDNNKSLTSPISGLECENYQKRPIAVMLSGDEITRPLSSISQADLIVDMPIMKNGVNRLMAVFVCKEPLEIGSIRSARHDFIPLAISFDAILVHWGGSHFAMDEIKKSTINNIDAIYGHAWAFYRKQDFLPQPHNGFISFERLKNAIEKLGYRQNNEFFRFSHCYNKEESCAKPGFSNVSKIIIDYPFLVKYIYNKQENNYYRWRNNKPEIDKNNGKQVKASVVAILRTNIGQIDSQYNNVDVYGKGRLDLFQNNKHVVGSWSSMYNDFKRLYFLDNTGGEIELMPGQIWIQIVDMETKIDF